ncbi:GATA zinc finger domain-containing protein 9-like [Impatiens glandulifera]|uniref:GATA zinc finger domain-containing protein 9-like n=1 Tax=Impatiens glandulifera TaxID=253017 RepID=UPI001FB181AE|nr:GATA zinc finger domain-containing protein 9-like [Impatiens glandulifera]
MNSLSMEVAKEMVSKRIIELVDFPKDIVGEDQRMMNWSDRLLEAKRLHLEFYRTFNTSPLLPLYSINSPPPQNNLHHVDDSVSTLPPMVPPSHTKPEIHTDKLDKVEECNMGSSTAQQNQINKTVLIGSNIHVPIIIIDDDEDDANMRGGVVEQRTTMNMTEFENNAKMSVVVEIEEDDLAGADDDDPIYFMDIEEYNNNDSSLGGGGSLIVEEHETPSSKDSCCLEEDHHEIILTKKRKQETMNESSKRYNLRERCCNCATRSSPLWRKGPMGKNTLCNACGIRYKKYGLLNPR